MAAHRHPAGALLLACLLQAPCPGDPGRTLAAPQPPRATLTGRATNAAKEELAGAVVALLAAERAGTQAVATTNARGVYRFESLDPGVSWSIQVEAPTYATLVLGPFKLAEDKETRVDVEMKLASEVGETVRVEAEAGRVELAQTATGTSFSAEVIEGLPLVGRRFADILTLAPGITDVDGDGNPNVRGARDTGLQLRLDGANVTDPLTGQAAQGINLETVQDVDIITAGAPAEFGRADGGFVNVITKSGGNEVDGSLKAYYRSDFLDGGDIDFNDTDLYATVGGPIVRDHAWYFASVEWLDRETPVIFTDGSGSLTQQEGYRAFGKVSWQASQTNKLALQVNYDPMTFLGNNIGVLVDPGTDYEIRATTALPQLVWTSTISPTTLMQTVFSWYRRDLEIEPTSDQFAPITAHSTLQGNGDVLYGFPCSTPNCAGDTAFRRFTEEPVNSFRQQSTKILESGPYSLLSDEHVTRGALRSDISLFLEGARVQQAIKGGFEGSISSYESTAINNPIITERTCDISVNCPTTMNVPTPPPHWKFGSIFAEFSEPRDSTLTADDLGLAFYIQDAIKPMPNLSISVGARFDQEEIDVEAFSEFDPRAEARKVLKSYDQLCALTGPPCTSLRTPGRMDGPLLSMVPYPPGHPVAQFDLNNDGFVDTSGAEGAAVTAPFTTRQERVPVPIAISNSNPALRFSISWDPWSDGKTKLYGTWGQYYDRLFLGATTVEQDPLRTTAEWRVGAERRGGGALTFTTADPGEPSLPAAPPTVSQIDRDVETPLTVEWTVGFERELAPEWSLGLAWISRESDNLLQDIDINHITCRGFDDVFGVKPYDVCGDGGHLEMDKFGQVLFMIDRFSGQLEYTRAPNGADDLYNLNPHFNQVMRVGNFNASTYHAAELTLRKRLHAGWQMQLSYTWSRALGDAESFRSQQGNDPAVSDRVAGYLNYDQTHVVKWEAVAHFQHDLLLGGSVQWASGLPFSFVANTEDYDDRDALTPQRVFSQTGAKNDQRNESQLTINGRIEKRFTMGATQAAAFIEAENLLDNHELVLEEIDQNNLSVLEGERRFGRRWQLGFALYF